MGHCIYLQASAGISVTFAFATLAVTLQLTIIIWTDLYIRAGFSEWRVIFYCSQFYQLTRRRLCTAGFTFVLKSHAVCNVQNCFDLGENFIFFCIFCVCLRSALAFIMNVIYFALGFVIASLSTPKCEQEQHWSESNCYCHRTDPL